MPHSLKVFILLIIPPIIWAGNNIVGKLAVGQIGPFSLSFFRWLIASILILLIAAKPLYESRVVIRKNFPVLVLLSILGTGLYNTFLYLGLTQTNANNAAIMLATMPLAIIGFSFVLGQERATLKQLIGLLVALIGVVWVIGDGNISQLLKLNINRGDLLVLCSVASWASYSVLLKKWRPATLGSLPMLAIQILIGTVFIFPFYLYELASQPPTQWNKEIFLMLAYVSIFPSLVAFYCWQQGVALGGANIAGLLYPSISLFTAIFVYFILHETLNSEQLIGAALIITGVMIAFISSLKKRYNERPALNN